MRRLLVTGGAGFIGANFVHYWLQAHPGERLVVLDALTYAGNLANLEPVKERPELEFVQGNICDTPLIERLLREERIDTIVHFAAESHVDRSIHGPDAFIETNVQGTHSMLKAARKSMAGGEDGRDAPLPSRIDGRGLRLPGSRTTPHSTSAPRTRRIHLTPQARRLRIIWCAPTTIPMAFRSRPATARTTTARSISPRS